MKIDENKSYVIKVDGKLHKRLKKFSVNEDLTLSGATELLIDLALKQIKYKPTQ